MFFSLIQKYRAFQLKQFYFDNENISHNKIKISNKVKTNFDITEEIQLGKTSQNDPFQLF